MERGVLSVTATHITVPPPPRQHTQKHKQSLCSVCVCIFGCVCVTTSTVCTESPFTAKSLKPSVENENNRLNKDTKDAHFTETLL